MVSSDRESDFFREYLTAFTASQHSYDIGILNERISIVGLGIRN